MGVTIDGSQGLDTDNTELTLEVGGSEKARVDSSGNLLVGKTSSGIATAGVELRSNDDVLITKDGDTCLYMNRLTSDGTIIEIRKDGTTKGSIGVTGSNAYFNSSGGTTKLFVSGVDTYNADSTAFYPTPDNAKDLGYSSFRWNDLYLGGGVYVGGTGSANYLDDYEEGTWTPVIRISNSSAGITFTTQGGSYTKIGRQVTCNGVLIFSNKGSNTGAVTLDNIPFAVADLLSGTGVEAVGLVGFVSNMTSNFTTMSLLVGSAGTTECEFYYQNAADTAMNFLSGNNISNNTSIRFSFTYFTNS